MKVVIDTNVLISLLFGKSFFAIKEALKNKKFKILISSDLFAEFVRVLSRPKFNVLNETDKRDLFFILETEAVWINVKEKVSACRDSKDNIVLECALSGNADYIVTGDKDLLILNPFKNIEIIPPSEFGDIVRF